MAQTIDIEIDKRDENRRKRATNIFDIELRGFARAC